MTERLLAPTFLFRFAVPCLHCNSKWGTRGLKLTEQYRLPTFAGELEDAPRFADVRLGWNESGLLFNVRVAGKKQAPWCRDSRPEDSDGVSLLIDTRDTHNIHRASRFCHQFLFLPQGAGRQLADPVARLVDIPRARENPKPVDPGEIQLRSEKRIDGYLIQAFVPGTAITGYDPAEHTRLGFSYVVTDRELGWQTFSVGSEFPLMTDPSLWGTLQLEAS